MTTTAASPFAWTPDQHRAQQTNTARFMRAHGIATYRELVERSQQEPEWFWDAVVRDLGISFSTPYTKVLDATEPAFAQWFVGGKLNLVNTCVFNHAHSDRARHDAIIWEGEDEGVRRLHMPICVARSRSLRTRYPKLGVEPGDAVGMYLPMVPEVIIAMYACAALGAMAVPIFSGFAAEAVAQRLQHCKARVVLCADGTMRRGKQVQMKHVVDAAVDASSEVEHVVVWRRLGLDVAWSEGRDIWWHEATANADASRAPLEVDAEHPFLLAYTSGTTGVPKAAVHVHGGFLAKIAQEAYFQVDMRPDDVLHWVTDMGWIMAWETIGAHAIGGSLVLAEGAPDFPAPDRLWQMVDRHGISILGVSPTLIRALKTKGDAPLASSSRASLRVFGSTGEPWNPEPYLWLQDTVGGGRCPIINLSGGTEVGACFLSPTPMNALKPCTLGGPALGMSVEVRDPQTGEALGQGDGVGELVCTRPWPGMTRGFWGEGGRERYLATYWSRWPDVWVHGDWASIDSDGLWFLHGRSDDTINVAGKRIGPAEYESILVDHESVAEAAAIGVPDAVKGESVWCYVVLAPGRRSSDRLRVVLADMVAERLGKAFRPSQIRFAKALPKTRSAKIVRRAIRAVALERDLGDISSIENPDALKAISHAH